MSRLVRSGRRWFGSSEDRIAVVFLGAGSALTLVAFLSVLALA